MTETEDRLTELFEELVPVSGKADTVAGEIVRAINRIGYRNYNDGDHIGVGYGKETCNAAARFLMDNCDDTVKTLVQEIWGEEQDVQYDAGLATLEKAVLTYLEQHPELKQAENTEDMYDYYDCDEDVDRGYDEEEDESYQMDW